MKLSIKLSDPVEIQLAVKFMASIAVHRDQEGCFHAVTARQMAEGADTSAAKEVIAKAKGAGKASEPTPAKVSPETTRAVDTSKQADLLQGDVVIPTTTDLLALAQEKSQIVGSPAVKEVIAAHGATVVKYVPEANRISLKAALEAIA